MNVNQKRQNEIRKRVKYKTNYKNKKGKRYFCNNFIRESLFISITSLWKWVWMRWVTKSIMASQYKYNVLIFYRVYTTVRHNSYRKTVYYIMFTIFRVLRQYCPKSPITWHKLSSIQNCYQKFKKFLVVIVFLNYLITFK